MYYSSRIIWQTVPQIDSTRHVYRMSACQTHNTQHTDNKKAQDTRWAAALPTFHRHCPPSTRKHAPWTWIVAPWLPMNLLEAPSIRAQARCVWSLCLGRQNGTHLNIERWVEHQSWMAAAQWMYATTKRTMVSPVGGSLDRRFARAERVGEDVHSSL
jgi:hypothetical protein